MSDVPQEFSGGVRPQDRRGAEDVLRALLECEYHRRLPASAEEVARTGGLAVPAAARWLGLAAREGLAEAGAGGFSLTEAGRKTAVRVMRAHRLTEVALARGSGLRAEEWHARAHAAEHRLTDAEVNRLAEALGHPRFDPHGDPIPTREGAWPEREGLCLTEWPAGVWGVIGHIEDEPKEVFAGIAAKGIFAGMRLVSEGGADGARVVVEGEPFALTREEAALVRVRGLGGGETPVPEGAERLDKLPRGGAAVVLGLLAGCMGGERSRLLDLGFVPGSRISHELDSPLRGPSAFRVRGSLVALRKGQAAQVLVAPETPGEGAR